MKTKILERFCSYLIVFLLPFLVIFGSFLALFFSTGFYHSAFNQTGVYRTFASNDLVDSKLDEVLQFMNSQGSLDGSFFSSQAIAHLTDVRKLIIGIKHITVLYGFTVAGLISYLVLHKQYRRLAKSVAAAAAVTAGVIFGLQIGIVQNFDLLFFQFHKAIFANDLWLFPSNDNLMKLFPQPFFVLFAQQTAQLIVVTSVILLGAGLCFWQFGLPALPKRRKGKRT